MITMACEILTQPILLTKAFMLNTQLEIVMVICQIWMMCTNYEILLAKTDTLCQQYGVIIGSGI